METKVKFEENDIVGESTLEVIAEADKFNRWMYQTIKPYCKGKVLEIGSGIGNISSFFMEDEFEILLTDIRKGYCQKLEERFQDNPFFMGTEVVNLTDEDFDSKFENHLGQYDTVFALNVVEHIYDDALALKNCRKLLIEGGQLIILVPSYKQLYNRFDEELGHYRRYTKSMLSSVFLKNNFKIIHKQYFNFIGIFGWYVTGSTFNVHDIEINELFANYSKNPVLIVVNVKSKNPVELPTKAFFSESGG